MKFRVVLLATLIAVIMSFPAYAKKKSVGPFFLQYAITLNGASVPSGVYVLSWDNFSSTVRVTLWQDGHFVATARGYWVKQGVESTENTVLLRVNSDGSRSLMEIRLAGLKITIVLDHIDPMLQLRAKSPS